MEDPELPSEVSPTFVGETSEGRWQTFELKDPFQPLSDEDWRRISFNLGLPKPKRRPFRRKDRKGGRPPIPDRACFEAVLWLIMHDGVWRRLPKRYGSSKIIIKRLRAWERMHILQPLFRRWLERCSIDAKRHVAAFMHYRDNRSRPEWSWGLAVLSRVELVPRVDRRLTLARAIQSVPYEELDLEDG